MDQSKSKASEGGPERSTQRAPVNREKRARIESVSNVTIKGFNRDGVEREVVQWDLLLEGEKYFVKCPQGTGRIEVARKIGGNWHYSQGVSITEGEGVTLAVKVAGTEINSDVTLEVDAGDTSADLPAPEPPPEQPANQGVPAPAKPSGPVPVP